jgi:hypothetical protein
MSASGVKLFDDDIAADVRDLFREHLSRGSTFSEVTAAILSDFHEFPGTEDASLLWLPLAVMQWEYGVLEPAIRDHAFRVIDDGTDLRRWEDDAHLCRAREKVLQKLRRQLSEPNPDPRVVRLRKRIAPKCPWQAGDVFAYRLRSGALLLLRVVEVEKFHFDEHPVCEVLDWVGREIPEHSSIAKLKVRRNKRFASESVFGFPLQKKHLVRCTSTGLTLPREMQYNRGYCPPIDFDHLAESLLEYFGMSIDTDDQRNADP